MKYPIAIEPGSKTQAFGVVVPDLPGCFSAADGSIEETTTRAKEAIELWIETAMARNETIPSPSSLADLQKQAQFQGWRWAMAEIDPGQSGLIAQ